MAINLKQTWWHIEEIYAPTNARKIRQVMDLFTNQTQIPVILDDEFVGLRVIARNSSNREISFLEDNGDSTSTLILNLDPLNSFPAALENFSDDDLGNKDFRHVKIEIEYILTNPKIENLKHKKLKDKIWGGVWDKILQKKMSTIEIFGKIHPELYITLPLGWRMGGSKFFTRLLEQKRDREGYSVGMKCTIQNAESSNAITLTHPSTAELDMKFNKPFIKLNNGKRTYNYLIHDDSFSEIRQSVDDTSKIRFEFTYRSQISFMMAIVSLVPFLVFLPFSVLILTCLYLTKVNSFSILNSNFAIGYFILLASFSIFYYSLIKEGYNIPYKYWHIPIFFLSSFIILLTIFMDIYSNV
jgi:hypothetical protein